MIYAERDLVRVQGKRGVFRVTRIKFNGEVDVVDKDNKIRTFKSDMLLPAGKDALDPRPKR